MGAGLAHSREARPVYAEKRCCLPWPLMITGLLCLTAGAVVAIVTFVLSLTVNRAIFLLTAVAMLWIVFWVRFLRSNWPTGIWVDEAGIRIGDVRALRFAASDSQTVFTCSWSAVSKIAVTDRSWRRRLGRSSAASAVDGHTGTVPVWIRWLLGPFARALVVIYADRQAAGGPRAELVDNVFSFGTPPTRWTAFTRRPKALRAALAQVPGCPPVEDRIDPVVP
jgi:hypothetical protein